MEYFDFYIDCFFDLLMMLAGTVSISFSISLYNREKKLKRVGVKTMATVVGFSDEKVASSSKVKVPIFEYSDRHNIIYSVKGKSNSLCKIGEKTTLFYDPKNPEKEYYIPGKDAHAKFVLVFFGLFFFSLGLFYFIEHLNAFTNYAEKGVTNKYMLISLLTVFVGTALLYGLSSLNDSINRRRNKHSL